MSIFFSSKYYSSSLLISSKISVVSTSLLTSICSKQKRFSVDVISKQISDILQYLFQLISLVFLPKNLFLGPFSAHKTFSLSLPFTVFSLLELKKSCSSLAKVIFSLIFYVMNCLFASFCLSDHVLDIWFFTYWFYCSKEIFSCPFLFSCFISTVTIIFTMFTCENIKDHP